MTTRSIAGLIVFAVVGAGLTYVIGRAVDDTAEAVLTFAAWLILGFALGRWDRRGRRGTSSHS